MNYLSKNKNNRENGFSAELDETIEEIKTYDQAKQRLASLTEKIAEHNREASHLEEKGGLENIQQASNLRAQAATAKYELDKLKLPNRYEIGTASRSEATEPAQQ